MKGSSLSPIPERAARAPDRVPAPARVDAPELVPSGPFADPADAADSVGLSEEAAERLILAALEDDKAEDIVSIDIRGKSSVADRLIVASGRSHRHVGAIADHLTAKLKSAGAREVRVEGLPHCDWVLVDAGDVIVHVFRPEVRSFYNIEKIWAGASPAPAAAAGAPNGA